VVVIVNGAVSDGFPVGVTTDVTTVDEVTGALLSPVGEGVSCEIVVNPEEAEELTSLEVDNALELVNVSALEVTEELPSVVEQGTVVTTVYGVVTVGLLVGVTIVVMTVIEEGMLEIAGPLLETPVDTKLLETPEETESAGLD